MGTTWRPIFLSLTRMLSSRTKAMVVENSRPSPDALSSGVEGGECRNFQRFGLILRCGRKPPSSHAPLAHIGDLGESCAGMMYSRLSTSSSVSGSLKRLRKP